VPVSAVLRDEQESSEGPPPPSAQAAPPAAMAGAAIDALLRSAQEAQGAGRAVGILPLEFPFPAFGSVLYLASELTPETQTAELSLEYHRTRGN
jgi:hypothetical protein